VTSPGVCGLRTTAAGEPAGGRNPFEESAAAADRSVPGSPGGSEVEGGCAAVSPPIPRARLATKAIPSLRGGHRSMSVGSHCLGKELTVAAATRCGVQFDSDGSRGPADSARDQLPPLARSAMLWVLVPAKPEDST
jgi:hypothetical protein